MVVSGDPVGLIDGLQAVPTVNFSGPYLQVEVGFGPGVP
jgi:hypothetical protein